MDVPDVATHVRYEKIDPPQWFNQKSTRSIHTVFWVGRHKVSATNNTRNHFFKKEIDLSISTVFPYRPGQRPRLYWKQLSTESQVCPSNIYKRASSMPFNSPCLEEEIKTLCVSRSLDDVGLRHGFSLCDKQGTSLAIKSLCSTYTQRERDKRDQCPSAVISRKSD
jgi:hypothetical protein